MHLERDKENLLRDFYSQDQKAVSQWKEYVFEDLELLKEIMPLDEKYTLWTQDTIVLPRADSVLELLKNAQYYGLQPAWYHYQDLKRQRLLLDDSVYKYDPIQWSKFEVLLSNAFTGFAQDIKYGKMKSDSIDLRENRKFDDNILLKILTNVRSNQSISSIIQQQEPRHEGYHQIKKLLFAFVPQMDQKKFTTVVFPWQDSLLFLKQLHKRLSEEGFLDSSILHTDSVKMSQSIKKAQLFYGLHKDGKAGKLMIAALNSWKQARYARMAINLDRYRVMPDSLPESFILVNIPSYSLEARYRDSLVFRSKVIVGKPRTRSPLLNSVFTNIVVYPQWNVPESIIFKEIIPKMQSDPHYLRKQNMVVLDKRDSIIDPATIHWAKANKKNFRYRIRQGEGLDNSLGIIKFNFSNPFSVYLHDTNARSLFQLEERSLSHGCIRVENWKQMANYLAAPSINPVDDPVIMRLLKAEKKANKNLGFKTYLYIRYFTLFDAGEGLKWYPDIYGEDNQLIDSYLY
jgi:murein L,D-transpeptidase YcbB/YkuD